MSTIHSIPQRETRAYIDLTAIEHNLRVLAKQAPGAAVMPAVKANAYGHGSVEVAQVCQENGASFLAVATLIECHTLLTNGITIPVLILQDLFPNEVEAGIELGARLACGSLSYARFVSETAEKLGLRAKIHVNVDTGIGRVGMYSEDVIEDLLQIFALPKVEVEGVFTHFSTSDELDKEFAMEQLRRFHCIRIALKQNHLRPTYFHSANSGAILDFPEKSAFDLVRPGVTLYGMFPSTDVNQELPLKPAMKVVSRIIKLTTYKEDWDIGYGRTFHAKPGTTIAMIPIGYGDGYPRALSNKAQILCHGRRVPLAGRVSMDMIGVDVTSLGNQVKQGDEVVLLGSQKGADGKSETITAQELAAIAGTITYEITCGFTGRVPRIYLS